MSSSDASRIFDLPELGNLELSEDSRNLTFRIEIDSEPYQFMATFVRKDSSRTLNNIEKDARKAGIPRGQNLEKLMRAVSKVLPVISSRFAKEEGEPDQEKKPLPLPEMIAEAEKEAERILGSQDPLNEVSKHLKWLVAGEVENSQRLFLKIIGAKSKDNRLKWIELITGESGSGKSTMMNLVIMLCNCKVVGRLTRHALDYTNLSGYDVLVLKEVAYLDKEDQGLSTLRFLSIDDKGYTVEVPIRDPETGEMTTRTYMIPMICVLSSSTRLQFDEQFERRTGILNPDESVEQTRRVKDFKAQIETQRIEVKLGNRKWADCDFAAEVLKSVLSKMEDVEVEIPFPFELGRALSDKKLRVRGDIDKLSANVRLYHTLISRSQIKVDANGKKLLFASPAGAVKVIKLFREPFESMISGIDRRTKQIIDAMDKLGYRQKTRISMRERMSIANETCRSPPTIYRFLERLYQEGKLNKGKEEEGRGSPVFYELIVDPNEMLGEMVAAESVVGDDLFHEMWRSGARFLKGKVNEETFKKIIGGWKAQNEKKSNSLDGGDPSEFASRLSLKSFWRQSQALEDERSPNQGDQIFVDPQHEGSSANEKGGYKEEASSSSTPSPPENSGGSNSPPEGVDDYHWSCIGEKLGWLLVCDLCGSGITNNPSKAAPLGKKHRELVHPKAVEKQP